jgi:diaminopropionate ammonia-lyase
MVQMSSWMRTASSAGRSGHWFSAGDLADVRQFYRGEPVTPLRHLPALARAVGVGDLLVKDETERSGTRAFKILGVRYAIARLAAERAPALSDVACATAGNHGLAVARVARERGLGAHVYVPFGTAPARVDALRREGAHVAVTSVDYDDTVRLMADEASRKGWTIVSDTAWEGYDTIPRWIMAGYTRLMDEAANQWIAPPDVVIVQAGVGGLAGAVAGWLDAMFGADRPALVIVEPEGSACVQASLRAGAPVRLPACEPTSMVGLRCGEVSAAAWPVIASMADAAIGIDDADCGEAVRRLAKPDDGDPAIVSGPSGAAGVAALVALARKPELQALRDRVRLSREKRVFVVVTEGDVR